jgi:RNA polymerase sigma factor (sigma-70 family)
MSRTVRTRPAVNNFEQAQVAYAGTIRTFARNCVNQLPGYDIEDIEQELLVELWKCVQKYDPNKGASFNTLFQGCARNKVITLLRHVNTKGRKATIVYLEDEAVAAAVAEVEGTMSAEDIALGRLEARDAALLSPAARAALEDAVAQLTAA